MKKNQLFFIIILLFLFPNINAQIFELEWKDSLESEINGYGDKFPILLVDSINESIYVAAHQQEVQTNIILSKFDFGGNKQWDRIIDYGFLDILYKLKLDDDGNIYVLKNSFGLVKYDSSGNLKWHLNYLIEGVSILARDFIIDQNNEVYIIGTKYEIIDSVTTIMNSQLLKLDEEGEIIWNKDYSLKEGWKLDLYNDTLNILGFIDSNRCVLNCSLNGDSLYLTQFTVDEFVPSYASLDNHGNFYSGAWFEAYRATKVNSKGVVQWHYEYIPEPGDSPLRSWYVKPDQNGNVYIAGEIYSDSSFIDILVTKLDQNGNLIWETKYSNQGDSLPDGVRDLFVSTDHIVITGHSQNQQGYKESILLVINAADGELVSEIKLNLNLNKFISGYSIKEDVNKNIYVTGSGFRDDNFEFLDIYKFKPILVNEKSINNSFDIQIFPNPFSSYITVTGAKENILIYDMFGRIIYSIKSENDSITLNLNNLSTGIYFISVKNNNFVLTKKIVKQ